MSDVFERLIDSVLEHKNREVREIVENGALYDNVAREVRGRTLRVGDKWLVDFASCNYLGFDLRPEIIASILPEVERWGTHPSWARMCCSPELYELVEQELAALLGVETTLLLPTISLVAVGLIPAITGPGAVIFADKSVHKVNHDGCRLARDQGAKLESFRNDELEGLERALTEHAAAPVRLIVIDGVLSVTGRTPDLPRVVELAKQHDAIVYIDDAHGFGILGEAPSPERPYGRRGNGVVRHFGLSYDNVLYVAGLSKAYSSLGAFVACSKRLKHYLKCTVTSYLVSGPVPTAALATALAGLRLNALEGDQLRDKIYAYATAIRDAYRRSGIETDNDHGFPIVSAYVGSNERVLRGGQLLFQRGIQLTLQGYPLVPRGRGVLRATPTAANTWSEVEQLTRAMAEVHELLQAEPGA
ncbi:MAG TPA: pyridoxal phosphate-dependent aminotransferase family protein [Polyangiaceae bacterium]|nr:pyridoxal phosphate-dependent aminotransferase family protein [Polyangiaceae bacterium]